MNALELTINGLTVDASGIDPNTTLLNFVRSRGLTGSKEGCAEGECGACAVALLRPDANGGSRYEAVNACLCLVASLSGGELLTVEGIGSSESPHPAQVALMQGGSQCGYCTPGFAVSLFCEYHRPDRADAINLEALCGNLCRCTGYRPIAEGALALGLPLGSAFTARLEQPAPPMLAFEYASDGRRLTRPSSLAELFATLEADETVKLIAGGTDVLCEVNIRHARYEHLVALEGIPELQRLLWTDHALEIGAAVSISKLEAALGDHLPLLAELFPLYASRLIRNRATLGGNLVTASPIGDSSPVLLALGASVRLESARGERRLPLEDFFTGFRKTALGTGEIVTAIIIPTPTATHQRFYKIAKRGRDDISTVSVAIALEVKDDLIVQAKLGLGGVAATPARAFKTEAFLRGKPLGDSVMRAAGAILESEFTPLSDHRGSAAYRSAMLGHTLERFISDLEGAA